jgi:DNA polymerase-3 subunit alpha
MLVKASIRVEEGSNPKIIINQLTPLEEAKPKLPRSIRIRVPLDNATEASVDALHAICDERKGEAKVMFTVDRPGDFMVVMEMESGRYNVCADRSFITRVEELCGRGAVQIID